MLAEIKLSVKSKKLLIEAIKIDSNYFDSHYNLARLEQSLASYERAASSYLKAHRLNSSHVDACIGYGQCLIKLDKASEAIVHYKAFLNRYPNSSNVLYSLACIYESTNDEENYKVILLKCIKLSPSNRLFLLKYASLLVSLKQVDKATNVLTHLLQDNPFDHRIHDELFKLLWSNGEPEPFQFYHSACDIAPVNSLVLELVKKLVKNNELVLALGKIEPFLSVNVYHTEALLIKGHIERELGGFSNSLETLKSIRQQDLSLASVLNERCITHLCLNQFAIATKLAEELTLLYPNNQGGRALLATCLKLNGEADRYNQLYDYQHLVKVISIPSLIQSKFNENLKVELEKLHLSRRHPLDQSLRMGTQTEGQLFNTDLALVLQLKEQIDTEIKVFLHELSLSEKQFMDRKLTENFSYSGSWSVILKQGGHHKNHFHSEGTFSASYYVTVPDAVHCGGQGWLKLGQPELSRWIHLEPDYCIKPEAGCLVIFPSYMWHGTNPLLEKSERVTVALDVKVSEVKKSRIDLKAKSLCCY